MAKTNTAAPAAADDDCGEQPINGRPAIGDVVQIRQATVGAYPEACPRGVRLRFALANGETYELDLDSQRQVNHLIHSLRRKRNEVWPYG